jgi:uncharacterized membrane protein YeaQ/YmgE (transglycosylase-associated protein family)
MKSFFENKIWVILLAVGAFVGLIILASGLGEMEFQPMFAMGMPRDSSPFDFSSIDSGIGSQWFRYLIPGLLLVMYLLMLGRPQPQNGRSLWGTLLRTLAFIVFFVVVFSQMAKQGGFLSEEALAGLPGAGVGDVQLQEFSAPQVTAGWAFWIISLLVLVFGVVVVFFINRAFDRFYKPPQDMDELAEIARTALNDLSGAKSSKNVIVRCYLDMNHVVGEKRGLVRDAATTPAEFSVRLEAMGLPLDAVHGLTEVFERVRYGGRDASPEEIKEAKRCLTHILKACETKA